MKNGFTATLNEAIARARAAGLDASGLEESAAGVYTTSSEYLGAMGEAILRFKRAHKRLPKEVAEPLDLCLKEIARTWPHYAPGPLGALLRWFGA